MVVTMIEEIFHLAGGPLDAESLGIFIRLALQYLLCQCLRNIAVECLWHHGELAQFGKRLQRWYDRDGDAHLACLLHERIELLVVVEELGYGVRGT